MSHSGTVSIRLICLLTGTLWAQCRADGPDVVVSIQPLHSIVASVMRGGEPPRLLLRGTASPHTYALRPSAMHALTRADLLIWVGEELESFLAAPIAALGPQVRVLTLIEQPGIRLPARRPAGVWESRDDAHGDAAHGETDLDRRHRDPHIWLDIDNARSIATLAADAITRLDPGNRSRYSENLEQTLATLDSLDGEIRRQLEPVAGVPYVVFHDAYQLFENRYGLNAIGAITVGPHRPSGAKRLAEIRAAITRLGARCVFTEPQFAPRLVDTIIEGTGARAAELDSLGVGLPAGPEAYPTLMRNLASALVACLGR